MRMVSSPLPFLRTYSERKLESEGGTVGDELREHGCFFVSIHLAKRELVAVSYNLSGENFLVGTAVDFKQPFLMIPPMVNSVP